jgi:phosphoribosyl-ATP pyrophosphohydrolase/phosphoribosyl-AMP cyclohydrolase
LVTAIIEDSETKNVLMLGYMNDEAVLKTQELKQVTFFSRSNNVFGQKAKKVVMF